MKERNTMKILKSSVLPVCVLALALAGCKTDPATSGGAAPGTFIIALSKAGTGTGTVTSAPAGISCDATCLKQSTSYPAGSSVVLTAAPTAGMLFSGWSVASCGTALTCTVTASGGTVLVVANFIATTAASDVTLLTATNKLVSFSYALPGQANAAFDLTSLLVANESFIGMDYIDSALLLITRNTAGGGRIMYVDPSKGTVLKTGAAGNVSQIYTLGAATGDAFTTFDGTRFAMDYNPNPLVKALRVVSDIGQNLTIDFATCTLPVAPAAGSPAGTPSTPGTCKVTTRTALADRTGAAAVAKKALAAAYTNNFVPAAEARATLLYVIDKDEKKLYVQDNNTGNLFEVGPISLPSGTLADVSDFDIRGTGTSAANPASSPDAVFVGTVGGSSNLYHLDLGTARATLISGPVTASPISTPLASTGVNPLSEGAIAVTVTPGTASPLAGDTYAINDLNQLLSFNRALPGSVRTRNAIPLLYPPTRKPTAAKLADVLIGADFSPANRLFYGISAEGNLYTIDPVTARGTFVTNIHASGSGVTMTPQGTAFGVDFNPLDGTLRLISNTSANWVIDPATGVVTVQNALHRGTGSSVTTARLTGAAFSNNLPAAGSSTLYALDTTNAASAVLATVTLTSSTPANVGQVTNVGSLGVGASDMGGFDIDGLDGTAWAVLRVGSVSRLYQVTLSSGAALDRGAVGAVGDEIIGLSLKLPQVKVYGLTDTGNIVGFNPASPSGAFAFNLPVSGLGGETLVSLDYRATDGVYFGVTTAGKVYTLTFTTPATPAGAQPTAVAASAAKIMLNLDDPTAPTFSSFGSATSFGSDFDPRIDAGAAALRVVTADNPAQNLRVNVVSGSTFSDGNLAVDNTAPPIIGVLFPDACDDSAAPQVGGIAFSNNASAPASVLYGINTNTSCLYTIATNGVMTAIDQLGVTLAAGAKTGFDIGGAQDGMALAALDVSGGTQSSLYSINLGNGAATLRGVLGPAGAPRIVALTIAISP